MNRLMSLLAVTLALAVLAGCNYFAYAGNALRPDYEKIEVDAQYRGLEGKRVAVLVAADEYTLFNYPRAQLGVAAAVAARLADNMPSITVMDPQQVVQFQKDNPYWQTARYSKLIDQLGTDAIVYIDIVEYRLHEPGNAHVWQGLLTANVGVIEQSAADADNFTYFNTVRAEFPENEKVGVLNSDDATMQLGLHSIFSRDAAGLFYDHVVTRPTR